MVVAEDRVGALALQLVDGLERLLAVAGAGIGPGRDERRGEVGGTPAPALREMRPGGRVLLRLEVLRPERQMRKPVGVVAPDDPVGEPEGVGHGAVGEERDEGPLQHLRIARVGLEGLAVVARRGRGVAQRAGDIGRKIVALEAVGGLEARRRRRPRREAPRGGGRRGRDAGRGDEQNRDESGEKARVRQRHEVRLQGGRAGARFEPHRQIGAHNGLCRAAPQGETMALCTAASAVADPHPQSGGGGPPKAVEGAGPGAALRTPTADLRSGAPPPPCFAWSPCNPLVRLGMMLGAVAGGARVPRGPGARNGTLGAPPVVPSTSNSRLGRKSTVAQGRGMHGHEGVPGIDVSRIAGRALWPDGIAFAVARAGKDLDRADRAALAADSRSRASSRRPQLRDRGGGSASRPGLPLVAPIRPRSATSPRRPARGPRPTERRVIAASATR